MRTCLRVLAFALALSVGACTEQPSPTSSDSALLALHSELASVRQQLRTVTARLDSLEANKTRTTATSRRRAGRAAMPAIAPLGAEPAPTRPTTIYSLSTRRTTTRGQLELIRGPRGGCYYIRRSGEKGYVDRSLCD
jgi:hypothetical protein